MGVMERRLARIKAYKELFESENGKVVLSDLQNYCHMFHSTYEKDTNTTMLNEGKRNVLLYILSYTNIDLSQFLKMMEDNRKEMTDGD